MFNVELYSSKTTTINLLVMIQEEILRLTCKKHIKIYKLKQLGLKNVEIAKLVGTNSGHVYNALKTYQNNPDRIKQAELL